MRYLFNMRIYVCAILLFCITFAFAETQPNQENMEQTANDYSEAQKLLFSTPHLDNIKTEGVLYYDFRQHGANTISFNDEITLTIKGISERGGKDVEVSFLSGENNRPYSDIRDFRSNPLLMFFLQWDVEKMDSGSKVTHHYFRHLLRQAFLNTADSEEIKIDFEGRKETAHRVFFQPLVEQQDAELYKDYPKKYYEFVLSDAVPGGVYSISTLIPSSADTEEDDDPKEPIESTVIRFNRADTSKQ